MYMIAEVSQYVAVASFAEAWIEMLNAIDGKCCSCVASFAEAWIEIRSARRTPDSSLASPPSRRRGLKCLY